MRLDAGRSAQKLRTRQALLAAARALAARGEQVTVTAAAAAAGMSRATAYRYFTSGETLTLEAALDARFATPDEVVGDEPDVRARVHRVRRYLIDATAANEPAFRLFLAKALEASVQGPPAQLRAGRRLPMFERALQPVAGQMPKADFDTLVHALSGVTGLEAYLAHKDVCQLSPEDADLVSRHTVDAILDHWLPTSPPRKDTP
jgi:AcrR family transcriptional regulator